MPSTPDDPGRAVVDGLAPAGAGPSAPTVLAHGTTVGTNALLERRGATVALVTNEGFADLIEIARQDRPSLYDQEADRPEPLVARDHRYEVAGRLDADGAELEPCDPATIAGRSAPEVEAVAVALLHADLEPAHEQAVAAALAQRGLRRDRLARGVARVPRVRAHRHDGDQRLPAARVPDLPARARPTWPTRCW